MLELVFLGKYVIYYCSCDSSAAVVDVCVLQVEGGRYVFVSAVEYYQLEGVDCVEEPSASSCCRGVGGPGGWRFIWITGSGAPIQFFLIA